MPRRATVWLRNDCKLCKKLGGGSSKIDHADGYEFVAVAMAVQGLGSCVLGSAPTAAAANAVPEEERAGALALLRVCGDLGLLTGSAGFGALAAAAGSDAAFGAASVLLVGTAVRFRLLAPSK